MTADGAWMVRRRRGGGPGWLLDLAAEASSDDWYLLNARARDMLGVVFDTPEDAIGSLRAAIADQVRVGQVWEPLTPVSPEVGPVQVTEVDHWGSGPDGTVYVRPLSGAAGWSPGDFRRRYRKLAG